ncbi:MAG: SpoIID/LytB domain-containing protein [Acidimicrobiales bacterium]
MQNAPTRPPHRSSHLARPVLLVAGLLSLLATTLVAGGPAAAQEQPAPGDHVEIPDTPPAPDGEVTTFSSGTTTALAIDGRGWGHGVGLGQWGAYGYARDHGWSYTQILDHFYGQTTAGSVGNQLVTVRLEAHTDGYTSAYLAEGDMTITTKEGQSIQQRDKAMRFRRFAPDRFHVEHAPSCDGPWTRVDGLEVASSEIHVEAPQVSNPSLDQTLAECTGESNMRWYRGDIRAVADPDGVQRTVNAVPLEPYLRGVVPREAPASWGDASGGIHALRAQAVAARTYTVAEDRWSYARTCDTTSCHVYGGRAERKNGSTTTLEHSNTDQAVSSTAGEIRVRDSEPIYSQYSASTGGHTKSQGSTGSRGWFPAVADEGDKASPRHTWTLDVPVSSIESRYDKGSLQEVTVLSRNGLGPDGGRVDRVRLQFSGGDVEISGNEFRRNAGLYSDWFVLGEVVAAPDSGSSPPPDSVSCPAEGLGSVQRLYTSYFGRAYDREGMAFWADRRERGWGLERISSHFAASPEFNRLYGELSDADFLDRVYTSVMNRPADRDGREHWLPRLDSGAISRGRLMLVFSDTSEYKRLTGNCA